MDFDDMLEELGELGKYQMTTYLLICLPVLFSSAASFTYVFTAGVPNYRCYVPDCDGPESRYNESWLSWAVPKDSEIEDTAYRPVQCERYVKNISVASNASCSKDIFTGHTERCQEWIFDTERTIVNDWNITCIENQWKLSLIGTCHFAGVFVGCILFGVLADKYGRKSIFLWCTVLMGVTGVIQAFSPSYFVYAVLMFINALTVSGVYPTAFIIAVEMVGRNKRDYTGMLLNYFCTAGEALIGVVAWLSKDWVWVQLCTFAPCILFIGYYWYIPESVRWLMAKQKNRKARGIVCKVAQVNKVTLSESLLDTFKSRQNILIINEKVGEENDETFLILKTLLVSKILVIRFLIIFYLWAATVFVYYGLSLNSTSIGGDKYLNFILSSLIEIPGNTIAWVGISKFGRRISLIGSLLVCGLTCCATVLVPASMHWAIIVLFLIGKMGVSSAFCVIYVHTAELMPTIFRSGGLGAASTVARVGVLLAPFVPLLGVYMPALPMLIFGGVSMLAGFLSFKLPETLGKKLPETIEDAERL